MPVLPRNLADEPLAKTLPVALLLHLLLIGGVGFIRVSGKDSFPIVNSLFKSTGTVPLMDRQNRTIPKSGDARDTIRKRESFNMSNDSTFE